jgi:integrase
MPRPKGSTKIPAYLHYKRTNRGYVRLNRRIFYCNGDYNSPESQEHYRRLLAEHLARGGVTPLAKHCATVSEVIVGYLTCYSSRLGASNNYVRRLKRWLEVLNDLYGSMAASTFGPDNLRVVAQRLAEERSRAGRYRPPAYRRVRAGSEFARTTSRGVTYRLGRFGSDESKAKFQKIVDEWQAWQAGNDRRFVRGSINEAVRAVKHMFQWAEMTGLVPASTWHALLAVRPLPRGRGLPGDPREGRTVEAVEVERIEATLPFLPAYLRDVVRLQLLTGARAGEVGRMRMCDIDTAGTVNVEGREVAVWVYRPPSHKGAWLGKTRTIILGPECQEIVKRYQTLDLQAYLFRPLHEYYRDRTAKGGESRPRDEWKRLRKPLGHLTTSTYGASIAKACRLAGVDRWHPHQLRHTGLTNIREAAAAMGGDGLDEAQIVAGHSTRRMTERYARPSAKRAWKVMAKLG